MTNGPAPRVDVIVPVHNQLHVVRPCLESVLRWTDSEVARVTVVADACDARTVAFLRDWRDRYGKARIFANEKNLGFVRSCNLGLKASSADTAILLNSDTCVTPSWAEKFLSCMASDPTIGVASPLSNFAPHMQIFMLPGMSYLEMAARIEECWNGEYPDVTTPEGFCFAIQRSCLATVGYLDEAYDHGYGEESDFALRANYHGFRTVCATDTYIYHRGRASYGQERRDAYYRSSRRVFNSRWRHMYPMQVEVFRRRDPVSEVRRRLLQAVNGRLEPAFKRADPQPSNDVRPDRPVSARTVSGPSSPARESADQLRVLCVLPTLNPYGGVISIANHVNDLIDAGHRVTVLSMSRIDGDVLFLKTEPVFLPAAAEVADLVPAGQDVLLATSWETVPYIRDAALRMPDALAIYYVQDIEADFFGVDDSAKHELALRTYGMLPHRVVKTRYLQARLDEMGWNAHLIRPGMNLDLFYPREVARGPEQTVLAMARPGAPGDIRGFEVLRETYRILRTERPEVRLVAFGSSDLPDDFPRDVDLGRLGRDRLPATYSLADVFVESSRVHGFGRCGVEAMACGTACVLSSSGGITEYARDGANALIVPVGDAAATATAVQRLLDDDVLRASLARAGLETVQGYASTAATEDLLNVIRQLRGERTATDPGSEVAVGRALAIGSTAP